VGRAGPPVARDAVGEPDIEQPLSGHCMSTVGA